MSKLKKFFLFLIGILIVGLGIILGISYWQGRDSAYPRLVASAWSKGTEKDSEEGKVVLVGGVEVPVLTILWDPQRLEAPAPLKERIATVLFEGSDSVRSRIFSNNKYFGVQKGGYLKNVGILGWYIAQKEPSFYWSDPDPKDKDGDGFSFGHTRKWYEALMNADADFDFSAYDTNKDRFLSPNELVIVIAIPQNDPFRSNPTVVAKQVPVTIPMMVDGVQIGPVAEVYLGQPIDRENLEAAITNVLP